MSSSDESLLSRACNADAEAFRTLLERHGGQVWREINSSIGGRWRSAFDADDVMQVTYMEAFLRVDQLAARDAKSFIAWLRRIAQNNLRDAIKELERKKRPNPALRVHSPLNDESCVSLIETLGTATGTPSRQVARDEAARAINSMLDRLPPDYGTAVRMYDLEGREIGVVAAAMDRSSGAVHMLRARAHDQLRLLLGAETDFFTHTA